MSGNTNAKPLTLDEEKIPISGYIALILGIVFFSGILTKVDGFIRFFDYTNLLGKFGSLGSLTEGAGKLASNFQGSGGSGVRNGWLFALSLIPGVLLSMAAVRVIEDLGGIKAGGKLLSFVLRPLMGVDGSLALAIVSSFQSTDACAIMLLSMHRQGMITEKEKLITTSFQYTGAALITNYFSIGVSMFPFLECATILPMAIIFVFKFVAAIMMRLYCAKFVEDEEV